MIPIFVGLIELLIFVVTIALIYYTLLQSMYLRNSRVFKLRLTVIDKVTEHLLKLNLHSMSSDVEFYNAYVPAKVCPELNYGDVVEVFIYKDPNKHIEKVYLADCKQYYVNRYIYFNLVFALVLVIIGLLLLLLL